MYDLYLSIKSSDTSQLQSLCHISALKTSGIPCRTNFDKVFGLSSFTCQEVKTLAQLFKSSAKQSFETSPVPLTTGLPTIIIWVIKIFIFLLVEFFSLPKLTSSKAQVLSKEEDLESGIHVKFTSRQFSIPSLNVLMF